MTKLEIEDLQYRIDTLERRLALREAECDRLRTIANKAQEDEEITVDRLTEVEIELENERKQRKTLERLLDVEKSMVGVLEDVIRATARLQEKA